MIVLWEPMYPGDARGKIPAGLFADRRVTSFWDPHELSGNWFGSHAHLLNGFDGGIVWDAYYAFAPGSRWRGAVPDRLVASGSDIIGNLAPLQRSFVPLLRS